MTVVDGLKYLLPMTDPWENHGTWCIFTYKFLGGETSKIFSVTPKIGEMI